MKLTRTEFRRLKSGDRVLLKQGEADLRLEAIVVVNTNYGNRIWATVEEILYKGCAHNPPIIRTSRVTAAIQQIYHLNPISLEEKLLHIFYVLKETVSKIIDSFSTAIKKSEKP
jgi:hypothetical protein